MTSAPSRASRGSLTDRGRALVAAGVTLAGSGMALGFVDLTRVGMLVISLPLLTLLTYQAARPRLDVERLATPATLTVDESSTVRLRVHNRSGLLMPESFAEEGRDPALGEPLRFVLPPVPRRGTRGVTYAIRGLRRGRHRLGPLSVRRVDPFGLCSSATPLPGLGEVLVLPRVRPLLGRAEALGGSGSSGADTPSPGATELDATSLRAYQIGDDLRRIHWPVTAHRDELTVRHDGRAQVRRAALCLDPSFPTGRGVAGPDSPALEWAVEAVASIAAHLHTLGFTLTLTVPTVVVDGHGGQDIDLDQTLRELALVGPRDGELLRPRTAGPRAARRPARVGAAGSGPLTGGGSLSGADDTHGADAATESPLVTTLRDAATGSGLAVLVVGTHDPGAARALLGTLPAGTSGLALLVAPGARRPVDEASGGSGRRQGGRRPDLPGRQLPEETHALAAHAAAGGWRARVVAGPEPLEAVWHDLAGGAR